MLSGRFRLGAAFLIPAWNRFHEKIISVWPFVCFAGGGVC